MTVVPFRTWAFALVGAIVLAGCSAYGVRSTQEEVRTSQVRYVMGTLLDITVFADSTDEGHDAVNEAFAIAEHLDAVLSTWKQESAVSRFNRDLSTEIRGVDEELYELVSQSKRLADKTDGAFSIGVRPLVTLWENAVRRNKLPVLAERETARRYASGDAVVVGPPSQLGKRFSGVMIETGGIGKGFAVDKMVAALQARGVRNGFINFGRSSIAALGAPPGERGWNVDVALTESTREGAITLRDETLTVSRARGNPFIVAGRSYAHIFDPASGMPVTLARGAAVRASSATDGEAFVKYLVIRGAPTSHITESWKGSEWIVRTDAKIEMSQGWTK